MRFTVTRPVGATNEQFVTYARLLMQHGQALAKAPRVPDPHDERGRWASVWDTAEEAQRFAEALREETGDESWTVEPTLAEPSVGPFGPILIQLGREGGGFALSLFTLSRFLIRQIFPHSLPGIGTAFFEAEDWNEYTRRGGTLTDLVRWLGPASTGLTAEQLAEIGYAVVDDDEERTWVYVPPAELLAHQVCSSSGANAS